MVTTGSGKTTDHSASVGTLQQINDQAESSKLKDFSTLLKSIPVEIRFLIDQRLELSRLQVETFLEAQGDSDFKRQHAQQYTHHHFGLRKYVVTLKSKGVQASYTSLQLRDANMELGNGPEKALLESPLYYHAETIEQWRDTPFELLTPTKLFFRLLLLGSNPSSDDEPLKVDSIKRLESFFKGYWPPSNDAEPSCQFGPRYELLVLLLARHFSPPPRYYRKDFSNEETVKQWLDVTGFLFRLLREEIFGAEDKKIINRKLERLGRDLGWFVPIDFERSDLDWQDQGWYMVAKGKEKDSSLVIMELAIRCIIVDPLKVVDSAWKNFYEKKSDRITFHCEDVEKRALMLEYTTLLAPLNKKGSLVGILRLLLKEVFYVETLNAASDQTRHKDWYRSEAAQKTLSTFLPHRIRLETAKSLHKLPKDDDKTSYSDSTGFDCTEIFLPRYPYKEKALADAVQYLRSLTVKPLAVEEADSLVYTQLDDRVHYYITFLFVPRFQPQLTRESPIVVNYAAFIRGGEQFLLPAFYSDGIHSNRSFGTYSGPGPFQQRENDRASACPPPYNQLSLLHQLAIYRAPATIQKLVSVIDVTATNVLYNNTHPLTYVVRQLSMAVHAGSESYAGQWVVRNIDQIAESIRIMLNLTEQKTLDGKAANPFEFDRSPDVAGKNVHAVHYASTLGKEMLPILEALLSEPAKSVQDTQKEANNWRRKNSIKWARCGFSQGGLVKLLRSLGRGQIMAEPGAEKERRHEEEPIRALLGLQEVPSVDSISTNPKKRQEILSRAQEKIIQLPELGKIHPVDSRTFDEFIRIPDSYPRYSSDFDFEAELESVYSKQLLDKQQPLTEQQIQDLHPLIRNRDPEIAERIEFFTGTIPNGQLETLLSKHDFGPEPPNSFADKQFHQDFEIYKKWKMVFVDEKVCAARSESNLSEQNWAGSQDGRQKTELGISKKVRWSDEYAEDLKGFEWAFIGGDDGEFYRGKDWREVFENSITYEWLEQHSAGGEVPVPVSTDTSS